MQPVDSLIHLGDLGVESFVHVLKVKQQFAILVVVILLSSDLSSAFHVRRVELGRGEVVGTVLVQDGILWFGVLAIRLVLFVLKLFHLLDF